MTHQMIDIAANDASGTFQAYLSLPPSGKGPGLVIAQEIFGVNQTMRDAADVYAAEGYVVLVPDLFWRQEAGIQLGYTTADWQRAFGFYQGFSEDKGVEDLQASLTALRARAECVGEAGVLGFCLGGKLAYLAACRTDAAVSVSYYGVGIEKSLDEATQIKGHLVLHIAENDQFCPPEARSAIVAAMSGRADTELYVYPGVDHAFARVGGEHFDAASAAAAHQRSMEALKSGLGPH
jgi:carboxymethylenebutenolidase